jgi:hypothetical protein
MLSNITEALKIQKYGTGYYQKGKLDFIVVVGILSRLFHYIADIENAMQFKDIVKTFLQPEAEGRRCQLLILARREPPQDIKLIINNAIFERHLKYYIGSSMREEDLKRLQVHRAACIFIFPSMLASDLPLEDEQNILRTWAISDFIEIQNHDQKIHVPIYLLSTQPDTANYVRQNASVACAETIRQSLLANTVLYSGYSTLILNLFLSSAPSGSNSSLWLSQYEDGSGNEIYEIRVTESMDGASFTDLCFKCFEEFQVVLFGVKIQINKTGKKSERTEKKDYILLNPGKNFFLRRGMICLFIAQDRASVLGVEHMKFDLEKLMPNTPSVFDDYSLVFDECFTNENSKVTKVDVSPCTESGSPLCHLLVTPATLDEMILDSATHLNGHILICTKTYRLEHFISILRGKKISRNDFRTLVFLCPRLPDAKELAFLCQFPAIHIIIGNGRVKPDLMRAGFAECESIMINNDETKHRTTVSDTEDSSDFVDSTTILISQLCYEIL